MKKMDFPPPILTAIQSQTKEMKSEKAEIERNVREERMRERNTKRNIKREKECVCV
jgi:hypothetical protein